MATASGTDAIRAARAAGFPDDQLVTAGAVAYAESGLRLDAVANEPDGSHSYGLWQINSVHGYPEIAAGTWSQATINAQLAYRVWKAQGWNAWSVHKPSDPVGHARYLAAIPLSAAWVTAVAGAGAAAAGTTVAGTGEGSGLAGAAEDAANAALAPLDLLKKPLGVLDWLTQPETWMRILKITVGGALMIGGAWLLVDVKYLQPIGEKVAGVAVKAAPGGAAAKGAAAGQAAGAAGGAA